MDINGKIEITLILVMALAIVGGSAILVIMEMAECIKKGDKFRALGGVLPAIAFTAASLGVVYIFGKVVLWVII